METKDLDQPGFKAYYKVTVIAIVGKPIQKQNEDKRNRMEDSRNKSTQIYPSNLKKDIKKSMQWRK